MNSFNSVDTFEFKHYSNLNQERRATLSKSCLKCQFMNPEDGNYCGKCGSSLYNESHLQPMQIEDVAIDSVDEILEITFEELASDSLFAGRYQIIEKLGEGGMGKIYKVQDKEVNAKIALKLIRPEIAVDEKTIHRFRN